MSKLNRREFKELLTEWNSNFINEDTSKKQNLVKFFDFAKLKLPLIIALLDMRSLEKEGLGLHVIDGNHRLEIFKRILSSLNESQGIPAIILCKGKEHEDALKNFIEVNDEIRKRISEKDERIVRKYINDGYKLLFSNSLKIDDFGSGENRPTDDVNDYLQSLYEEFIKDDKSKTFDISNLINYGSVSSDVDDFVLIP